MNASRRFAACLLGVFLIPCAAAPGFAVDMEEVFDSFYAVELDAGVIPVEGLELRRADLRINLIEGVFIPARPIAGVVTGGIFVGKGELQLSPSQAMDRAVLARRTQEWLGRAESEYKSGFEQMVLRFNDDTMDQLGEPGDAEVDRDRASKQWEERNKILENIETLGPLGAQLALEIDFLERLVNGLDDKEFFLADFETEEDGWLFYLEHQGYTHEIFFGERKGLGGSEEIHPFMVAHVAEDYDDAGSYVASQEDDDKLTLDTEHYRVSVTIPDTKHLFMGSTIDFTPRVPLRLARFQLVNSINAVKWDDRGLPVDVSAVTDGDGNPLTYLHKRHSLLIEFPEPLPAGEGTVVNVTADEETIQQITPESYELVNTYPWFPWSGFLGGRNTHEWVVKIKKPLVAVVSGRLMREWEEDDLNCTGWMIDEEAQLPSLLFGKFQSDRDVYTSELTGEDVTLRVYAIPQGTVAGLSYSGLKRMQPILNEAKQILKLFESLFGPYPYDYLNIAQMAVGMGFGQAPPGLVQLTGEAFMSSAILAALEAKADFLHGFLSHEIAHQWWAHVVWGTSFRDAWFSESFAEYASGLYVQQLQGQTEFQGKLREWRQMAELAEGSAPIAALATLGGDRAFEFYTEQIYNKGPYVLHMLRMQMGHDDWVKGIRAFTEKYRHSNVTTEMLIAELEQVAGYDMDFFFDQWWKGMYLPEFDFSYEVTPTEDGRYLFTGHITQDGEPFKVLMPVFFHFKGGDVSIQNRPVLEAQDVYKAFLPAEPKSVTLDDFNTLLARIDQSGDAKKGKGKKKGN